MDPISQGSLGAIVPASVWRNKNFRVAIVLAFIAALAPDLDVFIQSDDDPLLFLEYHRQFTHSLLFIPFGALFVATVCWPFTRKKLKFQQSYFACFLGYATHSFLDACTTYGTQMFWPLSDFRVSWNVVSIIDPIFTLPLLFCVIIAVMKKRRLAGILGLCWVLLYLSFGLAQHQRAMSEGLRIAKERRHTPTMLSAKPTFANLIAWKVIYLHDGMFYIEAVRTGWSIKRCGYATAVQVNVEDHFQWLEPNSQQAVDIQRFAWFSQDYVALDPKNPLRIIDMRYTFAPNIVEALWGITLDPNASSDQHIVYFHTREATPEQAKALLDVITGRSCA